jgi:hypothetical protein
MPVGGLGLVKLRQPFELSARGTFFVGNLVDRWWFFSLTLCLGVVSSVFQHVLMVSSYPPFGCITPRLRFDWVVFHLL